MRYISVLAFIFFMSCNSKPPLDIQGHRGCRGLLPENSLPAFQKAIELGVTTLELDLAISKDKQVVVSHEPFISRIYCLDSLGNEIPEEDDKKYNLYQMTFEEIKMFNCGSKAHLRFPKQDNFKTYKPLLSEVITLADSLNQNIRYNIEIKAQPSYDEIFIPKPEEFVRLVLGVIQKYDISDRCNLQSFDVRVLNELKRQNPEIVQALLIDGSESIEEKLKELDFKPEIISPAFELLNKKMVGHYQNLDYKIIPWTVNTPEDMQVMIDLGVEGIITDYPDILVGLLTTYQQ